MINNVGWEYLVWTNMFQELMIISTWNSMKQLRRDTEVRYTTNLLGKTKKQQLDSNKSWRLRSLKRQLVKNANILDKRN